MLFNCNLLFVTLSILFLTIVYSKSINIKPRRRGDHFDFNSIMLLFNDQCVDNRDDVMTIVEVLSDLYNCIQPYSKYDSPLHVSPHHWLVFMEKRKDRRITMDCLEDVNIDWQHFCIDAVEYERIEFPDTLGGKTSNPHTITDDFIHKSQSSNIDVFILDTGVWADHDELGLSNTQLLPGSTESVLDWHGTHIASTISGRHYGVAVGVNLYSFNVCPDNRCGWSDIANGFQSVINFISNPNYAISGRRAIINYSLSGVRDYSYADTQYNGWIQTIDSLGGVIVTSAGNNHDDACKYAPNFSPMVVTVGAIDQRLDSAPFSNHGSCVDIWAPGVDIMSAQAPIGYNTLTGTSSAAAHISGLIVNCMKDNPDIPHASSPRSQILEHLREDSTTVPACLRSQTSHEGCHAATSMEFKTLPPVPSPYITHDAPDSI